MPSFWRWYDRASRVDFAGTLFSLIFDWKSWAIGAAGGAMTFLWAAIAGRDPLDVWALAVVVAAGLMVIAWVVLSFLRERPIEVAADASGGQSILDQWQRGEWEIAYPASRTPLPDWPIHQLFSHIEPDILNRATSGPERWDIIGDKIRDALSLNRLKAWGRPVTENDLEGRRAPITEIMSSYWATAQFTYFFFDNTAEGQPHTQVPSGSRWPAYTDIQVNRRQALAIWPKNDRTD